MTCSECPAVLSPAQVKRGNLTCSRACGATRTNRQISPQERRRRAQPAIDANRRESVRRIMARIYADLAAVADGTGLVTIAAAARVVRCHRDFGYDRGYNAQYQAKLRRRHALRGARVQVSRGTPVEAAL